MKESSRDLAGSSTALMSDASLRLGIPQRIAPREIRSLVDGGFVSGRVLPARHYGSVDVFLEAVDGSRKGEILVIDNGGRTDEACIGDLITLEARKAGLAGIVVWGCHRDSAQLREIGLPVFSLGPCSAGPTSLRSRPKDALATARLGDFQVSSSDVVLGDNDGVLFFSGKDVGNLVKTARRIGKTERSQAGRAKRGMTLREQFQFNTYLRKRSIDSSYTFRNHLRAIGGAVEE